MHPSNSSVPSSLRTSLIATAIGASAAAGVGVGVSVSEPPATAPSAEVLLAMEIGSYYEGLRLTPYRDGGGVWTVCRGITGAAVIRNKRYTEAECKRLELAHYTKVEREARQLYSEAHVHAIKAVRTASDALNRLQGLIAHEAAELTKAKGEQRSGILAAFGFGGEAQKPLQSVVDVQDRIDAFESVLPEHEQALKQAKENAMRTDAAVKEAESQILTAKADEAAQEEAKAFAAFKAAHLKYMATGEAAKRREQCIKLNPGFWTTRLYGDRHHIDYFVPTVPEMVQDLINQAEKGE